MLNWRGWLQLVFGLGALAFVFIKADPKALGDALRQTRIAPLLLAVAASLLTTWLMATRWGLILGVNDDGPDRIESESKRSTSRPPTSRLFRYYLIGIFFTNFIPGGGISGDVARLIYVDREIHDKPFVLSTLVYERLVGVFILLLIGVVATLAGGAMIESRGAVGIGEAALVVGFLVSLALISRRVTAVLARIVSWLGRRFNLERFASAIVRTLESIVRMRFQGRMLAGTVALSIAIRVVWTLGCYAVAKAMALPLTLITVFSFMSIVDLIRLLPISVGGLGVREWVMISLFAGVGLSREQALSYSLLVFAPIYVNAIIGGLIYVWRAGARGEQSLADVRASSAEG